MSERASSSGPTIGVLQSSPTNRRIFINVLGKEFGAEVRATGKPREALQMLREGEIDVFLGEKPLMTGQQDEPLLEEVWAHPEIDSPPIILTGYQFGQREAVRFIRSGVAGLLILPFKPETLIEKITTALRTDTES